VRTTTQDTPATKYVLVTFFEPKGEIDREDERARAYKCLRKTSIQMTILWFERNVNDLTRDGLRSGP
jgi:hypothetical protein